MLGVMALLLLFAVLLLVDALLSALRRANVPGFIANIFEVVFQGVHSVVHAIGQFLALVGRAALSIFSYPARGFVTLANATATAFARVGSWTRWLVRSAVPSLWAGLISTVANAVHNLTSLAYSLFQQAINLLNITRTALQALISTGVAIALHYARSLFDVVYSALGTAILSLTNLSLSLFRAAMASLAALNTSLLAYILSGFTKLATYSLNLANWAVHTATSISIDYAKKYADQLIDLYDKALAGTAATALAPAWPATLEAIDAISLALPGSIAAVLARIGAIPRTIPRSLALDVGAIAAVGTVAIDWVARCGLSLCRNAKGFGEDLAMLEDAAIIAAIFELVVEGVTDPAGTARFIHDEIVEPLSTVGKDFAHMAGIGG